MNDRAVSDFDSATRSNQERMNADPFATILRGMGIQLRSTRGGGDGSDNDDDQDAGQEVQCRQS